MEKLINKITLGNSMEILDTLPDNSIDFLLTDPPYFKNMKIGNIKQSVANKNPNITKIERERERERQVR